MTLFDRTLERILTDLTSDEDRQLYIQDAEEIHNFILRKMKEKNKTFAELFVGSDLTGSILDDLKFGKPDEFDIHIKLQLPHEIFIRKGFSGALLIGYDEEHIGKLRKQYPEFDIFDDSWICTEKLHLWINKILESIFMENELILPPESDRTFIMKYSKRLRGYAAAHTIVATDEKHKNRKIFFDLVPAFEFGEDDWVSYRRYNFPGFRWFAVPSIIDDNPITIYAPHLERELLSDKTNLIKSLCLLKAIRDNNGMPHLTSYLMKIVCLHANDIINKSFWEESIGNSLICIMERLLEDLDIGKISHYWDNKVNVLECLKNPERMNYQRKMKGILELLIQCRDGEKTMWALENLFR